MKDSATSAQAINDPRCRGGMMASPQTAGGPKRPFWAASLGLGHLHRPSRATAAYCSLRCPSGALYISSCSLGPILAEESTSTLNAEDVLVKMQLLLQRRLNGLGLPPSMSFALENCVFDASISFVDRFHDDLGLVRRHNAVDRALQHLANQNRLFKKGSTESKNVSPIKES